MDQNAFSQLTLHLDLLTNLESMGYQQMTPIQAKSLPFILDGKDVIAQGKTGSGKTAAFGLGVLQKLEVKRFCIQTLVLCPTRELADQVATELRKLARTIHNIKILTLCGGMPLGPQIGSLEHGAHIVVGTPGRIEEHLRKETLSLKNVTTLVLDEADRMLDMGFQDSLDAIIEQIPTNRQTLLFSATYPEQIQSIAERIMDNPISIQVESTHDEESIRQHLYQVEEGDRLTAVRLLLMKHQPESSVVFCNTKREAQDVAEELKRFGFSALPLHGDLEQRDRDQALIRFANKSISILVATDVAARGLDIEALDAVINYHVSHDVEVHVHRIGRTGRAGRKGIAATLFTSAEDYKVERLQNYLGKEIDIAALPSESFLAKPAFKPTMQTLQIDGGKKQKVRAGDILGALTGQGTISGQQVGKINIADNWSFVAVKREVADEAFDLLGLGKLKGRSFRVRRIGR